MDLPSGNTAPSRRLTHVIGRVDLLLVCDLLLVLRALPLLLYLSVLGTARRVVGRELRGLKSVKLLMFRT